MKTERIFCEDRSGWNNGNSAEISATGVISVPCGSLTGKGMGR